VKVGVEEKDAHSLYASVAPNPARDFAKVEFFNPADGNVQFELYSLQGQLMQRTAGIFSEGTQEFELDLQGLMKGFYLLRMTHESGLRQTVKLIVR
jgi:hypothetical protein